MRDLIITGAGPAGITAGIYAVRKGLDVLVISKDIGGDAVMREKVIASEKVSVFNSSRVSSVFGDKLVSGIKILSGKNERALSVQGVFVEIGLVPNSGFIKGVDKNEEGEGGASGL